jgi:hypothetical protein
MHFGKTFLFTMLGTFPVVVAVPVEAQNSPPLGFVNKLGVEIDIRSGARILRDETPLGTVILPDSPSAIHGGSTVPQIKLRGGNLQVNDPALDYIQIFDGSRPFMHFTESEVSMAAANRNIVVTYNNSAGIHVSPNPNPGGLGLIVDQVLISGFSVSRDGGQTWQSSFFPPAKNASDTYGDPSIGVDRHGVFLFCDPRRRRVRRIHGPSQ